MHKPTHLRSDLVKAASSILTEGRKIEEVELDESYQEDVDKMSEEQLLDELCKLIRASKKWRGFDAKTVEARRKMRIVSKRVKMLGFRLESVEESAKPMVDPVKNSKGLHNSPKPLGQATVKELEASKKWYQETIEKHKETKPSFSVRLKQLLTLVNTELASRIGKKNNPAQPIEEAFPTTLKSRAVRQVFVHVQDLDADELEELLFGLAGYMHKVGRASGDDAMSHTGGFIWKAAKSWRDRRGN